MSDRTRDLGNPAGLSPAGRRGDVAVLPRIGVGVLGCGNVGSALVRNLIEDAEGIAGRCGMRLEVAGVAVADPSKDRPGVPRSLLTSDAKSLVADASVDVVVELIGGVDPAMSLVEAALEASKPVVTANKTLIALHGSELEAAAAAANVDLLYEAAVAGAIPLVRPLRESLAGERVTRVTGIVNGTTNFVLTTMSDEGISYDEALARAQELGLAESDPSADVEGYDAASKAAILAGIAFHCDVAAGDVRREGIVGIRPLDIAFAERLGYVVKLLAVAERTDLSADRAATDPGRGLASSVPDGGSPEVSVRVHPAMVPLSHPLAAVRGSFNAVFVEGETCDELMFYGRGAGGVPTASAVLGDLIDAAHNFRSGVCSPVRRKAPARIHPADDLRSAWYVSIDVVDRPGVLAAVAKVFGDNTVSIRSMEQVGLAEEARLVFLTHVARQGDLESTLQGLSEVAAVERIGGVMRVVGNAEAAGLGAS
ncbi:MAG: homoserine dehydrogenase [Actinobacteria bacterium]|nr:homoserine dehydrogenase [Actinomycetota bacterium]